MGFLSMGGSLNQMLAGGALAAVNPALVAGIGLGAADTANQFYWSQKNYDLQRRTYDYNQMLQALIFAREDNSVQRRVADLKNSGLSPVLAAGSGAGTGAAIALNTPQMSAPTLSDKAQMAIGMMKMEADISKTYAENQLIELQKQKVPYEIASAVATIGNTLENTKKAKADTYKSYAEASKINEQTQGEQLVNLLKRIDVRNAQATGTSGQGILGKSLNDIIGGFAESMGYQGNKDLQKIINEPKKRR